MQRNLLEPAAAVGKPPTEYAHRNGGEERPPERQEKIARQAENDETCPENPFLHDAILSRHRPGDAAL